jgi:OPA family sugar phosphate sensor protein UhpC-like MFS transporter
VNFKQFFRPAFPPPVPIQDYVLIEKKYKYWRPRILYSIYFGYVLFYFTRKSYTFAMPALMDDLGYSSSDLGFLGSLLYITYGLSKFFSGILSDQSNPRYFMAFGLLMTGLLNLVFGFSSHIWVFATLWALNGWFQGFGWPACTKQLTYWFSTSERGFWWSVVTTSHNVGGALIPILAAYCAGTWGWRSAMIVPGVIATLGAIFLIERLRDVPSSLGLPPVEDSQSPDCNSLSTKELLWDHVLKNRTVWLLSLSYFFVYIIRTAINDWGALYLMKYKGYSLMSSAIQISWFEGGGFLGCLAAGWGSDRFFQGKRVPYMVLCAPAVGAILLSLWIYKESFFYIDGILMALVGFFIFGPQMLVGLAASEFVDKKAACTANGFAGCFAYCGAAAAGYPLGVAIDRWGWEGFFAINIFCSFAIFLILLPLWSHTNPSTALCHES